MHSRVAFVAMLLPAIGATRANAEPPTDRAYAIELYEGVALGDGATIAMGGATVARAIGSAGALVNPSAPSVRATTDLDALSWDYHLDAVSSSYSTDADNNGLQTSAGGTSAVTAGIAGRSGDWAAAVTITYETAPLVDATAAIDGNDVALNATTTRTIVALSKFIPQIETSIGASLELAQFAVEPACSDEGCDRLFSIRGGGGGIGATWLPSLSNWRIGASLRSTLRGGTLETSACDPMDCHGYILPDQVVSPWRLAAGVAYRWAPTRWNQLVGGLWRDEEAVTIVADVVVTGASANAYGLEAFGVHELQPTGEHVVVSPRGGVEYEWIPGRLRVRGGSYWEPARYAEAPGRIHATFGIELRVLQVHLFGLRRGRITLTGDVARQYNNVGLSVGFWH